MLVLAKLISIDIDAEKYAYDHIHTFLVSKESRIRQLTAKALFIPLLSSRGDAFLNPTVSFLLEDIHRNMYTRDIDWKPAVLGQVNEVVSVDDDVGWNTLETSMYALKVLISQLPTNNLLSSILFNKENMDLLIKSSSIHRSRHIKQAGLEIASALLMHDNEHCNDDYFVTVIREATVICLDDNWTQVRYSAGITARSLLLKYTGSDTFTHTNIYMYTRPIPS